MVREKELFVIRMMKITDAFVIIISFIASFFISIWFRSLVDWTAITFDPEISIYSTYNFLMYHLWVLLISVPAWITLMSLDSVYLDFRTKLFVEISWRVVRTGIITVLFMGSGIFLLQMKFTSRFYVAIFTITTMILLCTEKVIWRWVLDYSYKQGYNLVNLLIVGTGKRAQDFIRQVNDHANWGLKIIGLIDDDPKLLGKKVMDYDVIGRIRDIPRIMREHVVDRVIFVVPRIWLSRIEEAIYYCEKEGVSTAVSIDLYKPRLAQMTQSNFVGTPLLVFQTTTAKEGQLFIKRMFDVLVSLIVLVLFSPILLMAFIGVLVSSRGPAFFTQTRCGLNGRKFKLYKFRSMYMGAEMKRKELEKQNDMKGPVFKMKRDPRVTPFGKFMRKFSIDELPQIINVLKGDMSLVGPRPALPTEIDMYESWQRRRLSMKPGITCIWQVSGRNKIAFEKWMEMDLYYIDHFSLWLDFKLLLRTFFVVITGYGAH